MESEQQPPLKTIVPSASTLEPQGRVIIDRPSVPPLEPPYIFWKFLTSKFIFLYFFLIPVVIGISLDSLGFHHFASALWEFISILPFTAFWSLLYLAVWKKDRIARRIFTLLAWLLVIGFGACLLILVNEM